MKGKIILVSLPIGNIKDITERAKETLIEENFLYAEDTRVIKSTLNELGIRYEGKFIDSFHDHTSGKFDKMAKQLEESNIVLVSDAGSPVISDPAFPLIKWAEDHQVEIDTRPGVSSVVVALELAKFPTTPFTFWGFLGRGDQDKKKVFQQSMDIGGTHVFFESPHRVIETLELLKINWPEVHVAVLRELTKKFQSIKKFKAKDFKEELITVKGEFVLVLYHETKSQSSNVDQELKLMVEDYIDGKSSSKNLAKIFSKITGVNSSDIYQKLNRK